MSAAAKRAIACVVVTLAVAVGFQAGRGYESWSAEQARLVQRRLEQESYMRQNYAFYMNTFDPNDLDRNGVYIEPELVVDEYNEYGITFIPYLILKHYESRTGTTLEYEMVIDYFSSAHEPDGSLRLYDNGLHPEMEAFVDWAQGRRQEQDDYFVAIESLYYEYCYSHRDDGFPAMSLSTISPQMLDELARKEADPSYEMDLITLYLQGY